MIDQTSSMLYHINNLNMKYERVTYQLASGKVLDQGSDDSMLHAKVISLENDLRVTEGLKLQIEKTRALNDTADANIGEMKLSLDSIKTDLMKGLNDGMDRSDKLALATNIRGIREGMIDRVNAKVDGEFLFTGSVTTNETLVKDDSFKLNGQINFGGNGFLREVAVQPGSYRDRGVTAYDVSFYNSDSATASTPSNSETLTFSTGERIIDENGHEWKLDEERKKLQQYDHNGILYEPAVEIDVSIPPSKSFKVDLGVGANTDANGTYNVIVNGTTYTYDGTAGGKSASDIYDSLKSDLEADGYRIGPLIDDDSFVITEPNGSTDGVSGSVSDTDAKYNTTATNEQEATAGATSVQGSYIITVPDKPEGRLFEAKHNYFDDLNVIINALEGHFTKLDGTKGNIANEARVDEALQNGLDQTTAQFNATNIGHGELGGRNNVFEVAYDKISTQETHYNILIQENNGADIAKLAMQSKSLEMTYQALYTTISKMNQLSLINFLK